MRISTVLILIVPLAFNLFTVARGCLSYSPSSISPAVTYTMLLRNGDFDNRLASTLCVHLYTAQMDWNDSYQRYWTDKFQCLVHTSLHANARLNSVRGSPIFIA